MVSRAPSIPRTGERRTPLHQEILHNLRDTVVNVRYSSSSCGLRSVTSWSLRSRFAYLELRTHVTITIIVLFSHTIYLSINYCINKTCPGYGHRFYTSWSTPCFLWFIRPPRQGMHHWVQVTATKLSYVKCRKIASGEAM